MPKRKKKKRIPRLRATIHRIPGIYKYVAAVAKLEKGKLWHISFRPRKHRSDSKFYTAILNGKMLTVYAAFRKYWTEKHPGCRYQPFARNDGDVTTIEAEIF